MLDEAERQECLVGLARYETWLGASVSSSSNLNCRTMPYLILPWAARIASDPRILDVIEDLIGPDILIWTSTFFIKEPDSPMVAAWHQDATYYGLDPVEPIAVWLPLTEASEEVGCMEVLSTGGACRQIHHATHVFENSVNRSGEVIVEALEASKSVAMQLQPGSFSIHHGLCPHRSAPNTTNQRRVGLELNYIPTHVRPTGFYRTAAMLVRGEDRYGHFWPVHAPEMELHPDTLAAHEQAGRRVSRNLSRAGRIAREGVCH
jgi:non-heme Fe2+,alpha-ketoglutarate-dependent halogenase